MISHKTVSVIFAIVLAFTSSSKARAVEGRESCVYTCGTVCYQQSVIDAALEKAYSLYQSDETLGRDKYPHKYNDYEGFSFPTNSPWYEFPILSSHKVYSGGSPGADRVIFDSEGNFDSLITHNGASGDDFVACASD